jgi:hypothetical protein
MDPQTPSERRDAAEEREADLYSELYDAEVERQRVEYEAEYGELYRSRHPFKVDGLAVHEAVMRRLAAMKQDD